MSGEDGGVRLLRMASRLMREEHGPEHQRHAMWAAMADMLDHEATLLAARTRSATAVSGSRDSGRSAAEFLSRFAIDVARTYLGADRLAAQPTTTEAS